MLPEVPGTHLVREGWGASVRSRAPSSVQIPAAGPQSGLIRRARVGWWSELKNANYEAMRVVIRIRERDVYCA